MGKTVESQKQFAEVRELHEKSDEPLAMKISSSPPRCVNGQPVDDPKGEMFCAAIFRTDAGVQI
jgi:hypothetical protein